MALYNAFHLISSGQVDAALVGGAQLCLSPSFSKQFKSMGALSSDGKCKFMDEKADGFVRSESCCVIFIQRLSCAKRVYARVLNVEANNDGRDKRTFLSPSKAAQIELFSNSLKKCNLSSNDVVYVEAHGTGTPVGDDIEIRALAEAYGKGRDRPLLVGSVKTNLGHTEATSGLCSIAKVIVMFERGWIPAMLHYEKHMEKFNNIIPNLIEPITVNTNYNDGVVGVNVYGMGGTNVHILLGELKLFSICKVILKLSNL